MEKSLSLAKYASLNRNIYQRLCNGLNNYDKYVNFQKYGEFIFETLKQFMEILVSI